ncbi:aspartate aminotransferase family protein [Gammaproteobacteria bacterium]|nr:aspartate aminotransferase family protein [Gammaproteobacteria bacterium]MDB9841951.1 aspartate aminotransferase family protein [Gammaproteobacteria bacterium]
MAGGKGFSHQPTKVEKIKTKHRTIKTEIPVPESVEMLKQMYSLEAQAMHGQLPLVWDKADNFQIHDPWGNVWLDFTSTIFVANAGHANKRIVKGLKRLLDKPLLHTYTFASIERINYLDYLIKNTPKQFEKAFLLSAGTETTEAALKLMRLNGQKKGKRKGGIVCFNGAYHGRTMGAQLMTGNQSQKEWVGYQDPNIHHINFPYPWEVKSPEDFFNNEIEQLLKEKGLDANKDLCGFMLETFQGWGAVFYPVDFVKALMAFSKKHDMLVTFDEMQAGFGRTGKLFGYEHYSVEPDILCCGKGASSGLPLAILLGSKEIMDLPGVGSMSSTHSANPLVCVAGHENLKAMIEDGLISNSKNLGDLFHLRLNDIKSKYPKHLKYVYGKGLLAALIFIDENNNPLSSLCDIISEKAFQKGLLVVHTGRESIKLAPPLSITKEALLEGLEVIEECIKESI